MTSPDRLEKRRERMKRIVARGRGHYVVSWGMIGWGIPTALIFTWAMSAMQGMSFLGLLPLSLTLFPMGGYLWGAIMWRFIEAQVKQFPK
jgi:hypothetical protein